jgi:hypothetical protein
VDWRKCTTCRSLECSETAVYIILGKGWTLDVLYNRRIVGRVVAQVVSRKVGDLFFPELLVSK